MIDWQIQETYAHCVSDCLFFCLSVSPSVCHFVAFASPISFIFFPSFYCLSFFLYVAHFLFFLLCCLSAYFSVCLFFWLLDFLVVVSSFCIFAVVSSSIVCNLSVCLVFLLSFHRPILLFSICLFVRSSVGQKVTLIQWMA